MLDSITSSLPVRYFRMFWGYAGPRILILLGLTTTMSYAEGVGIALFLPLFSAGNGAKPDALSATLGRVFAWLHVPLTPAGALPLIVGIFVLKGVLQYVTTVYQYRLTHRSMRALRQRLLSAMGRADYTYVIGTSAGGRANLVVTEVGRAASGFLSYIRTIPPAINSSVFFIIVFLLDWRLTLVCLVMGATMITLLRVSGRIARHHSAQSTQESSRLTSLVVQTLQAFKYLRTTASYARLEARLLDASDRHLDADFRSANAGAVMLSAAQPIMVVFLGGLVYYRTVVQGQPVASLFIVLMYFLRIMNEMFSLQTQWQSFCNLMGSVDAVALAITDTEAHAEPRGTVPFTGLRQQLACEGVGFAYRPDRPVLRDVTLQIPRNAAVAFVGESGSGKSTLVDLLMGTLRPDTGKLLIDGIDVAELALEGYRARVGYVPQDSLLFDDTVEQNIALWRPGITPEQVRDAARRAHCADFIEAMPEGYASEVGDRGTLVSGGQRQRLAIARELVKQPELLVLDEATSALDSASERAIQQSIDELKGKMTILLIAHRLSTVRSCDRIYVLHEGQIVEQGSYDELLARPQSRFRQMVELQGLGETKPVSA